MVEFKKHRFKSPCDRKEEDKVEAEETSQLDVKST
jgi:hypothetical protein